MIFIELFILIALVVLVIVALKLPGKERKKP